MAVVCLVFEFKEFVCVLWRVLEIYSLKIIDL